jgi:hypothetical protein
MRLLSVVVTMVVHYGRSRGRHLGPQVGTKEWPQGANKGNSLRALDDVANSPYPPRSARGIKRNGRSIFPAHANTGDPNGPVEACPLIRSLAR